MYACKVPDYNQIFVFSTYLISVPNIKFHGAHPQGAAMIEQTDGGTDMATLIPLRHADRRTGS
jgi:hypothetical protein